MEYNCKTHGQLTGSDVYLKEHRHLACVICKREQAKKSAAKRRMKEKLNTPLGKALFPDIEIIEKPNYPHSNCSVHGLVTDVVKHVSGWRCRICKSNYNKSYAVANKEQLRKKMQDYYKKNKKEIQAKQTQYKRYYSKTEKGKEKIKEYRKKYYNKVSQTEQYKLMRNKDRKNYENSSRGKESRRLNNRLKMAKARELIKDRYIKQLLIYDKVLKISDIPPDLIELKRLQLQLYRKSKEKLNEKTKSQQTT